MIITFFLYFLKKLFFLNKFITFVSKDTDLNNNILNLIPISKSLSFSSTSISPLLTKDF